MPDHTATGAAGKAIKAAGKPHPIAVTPDGTTACVASDDSATVTPICTAASRPSTPVKFDHHDAGHEHTLIAAARS